VTVPGLLILASLADGDKHGYGMMLDIQQFAGVEPGPGTLYGAITRLVESGWIRLLESNHRRRPCRITPAGRAHLLEQVTGLDHVVKTARPAYAQQKLMLFAIQQAARKLRDRGLLVSLRAMSNGQLERHASVCARAIWRLRG
jgi:DNA-binding PadR family transcriptional regulator